MNRCRECFAELSPGAAHCPQCGRKLGTPVTLPPSDESTPGRMGNWRIAIIAGAVLAVLVLVWIVGMMLDPSRNDGVAPPDQSNFAEATPPPARSAEPVATTAEDLGKAYDENELAARDRFEGGPVRLTGTVLRIGSNGGEPTLLLQSSQAIQAAFTDPGPLKALKAGEQVTITCEALAETPPVLALRGCMLNTQGEPATPVTRRDGPQ